MIWQRPLRRARRQEGVVLVEFAIVLPILVLIILGILYFGRYEDYTNQETQLAEEGARMASVNNIPSGGLETYLESQAQSELKSGSKDVTNPAVAYVYYPSGSSNKVGSSVRVCLVATFRYPILGLGTPTQTVAEAATMMIEQAGTFTPDSSVPTACPKS